MIKNRKSPRASSLLVPVHCLLLAVGALLSACGGNDGAGGNVGDRSVKTGVLVDARVSGVNYYTPSRIDMTNALGNFQYLDGEMITFKIGAITLGSVTASPVVTIKALVAGGSNNTPAVQNISRLLLSLDDDGDPSNGIQISQRARDLATADRGIDVAAADFDTKARQYVREVKNDSGASLTTPAAATTELNATDGDLATHNNQPNQVPVANAGANQQVTGGDAVTLRGGATDADGDPMTYQWTQTAGPAVTLSGNTTREPTFTAPAVSQSARLDFKLVAADNRGGRSLPATTSVTVVPASNPGVSTLSINDVSLPEGNSGTSTFSFTITRGGNLNQQVSVSATTADGTAQAGSDYVTKTQTITFASGETSKTFDVTVSGDTAVEPDETFTVRLSNPVGNADITRATGTGTIQNDDQAQPQQSTLSIADASTTEGNSGTKTLDFTITRGGNVNQAVTVHAATADGTATAGSDYVALADTTIGFASGETSKTLSVTINGDTTVEPDETFTVNLSQASANAAITRAQATGTIQNDDTAPPATGFPLCIPGAGCLSDIPGIGAPLQGVVDTIYNAVNGGGSPSTRCSGNKLCAGAAKFSVSPSDAQIAGLPDDYLGGKRQQQFHLGGFGFGPFKLVPSYGGQTPEVVLGYDPINISNPPAKASCFARDLTQEYQKNLNCEDRVWVRVMVLQSPDTAARIAFVTLDAVGAGNLIQEAVKKSVQQASCEAGACIALNNILFGLTHSHAAADLQGLWGGVPRDWIDHTLVNAAYTATKRAYADLAPVDLKMARGYSDDGANKFNSFRRPQYRTNKSADSPIEKTDHTVTVLQAVRADGSNQAVGTILQFAAHPTAIGEGDYRVGNKVIRVPHPDYPLGAENELERKYGGTALYYNGPIADASGSGSTSGSYTGNTVYDAVKNRGENLAKLAESFMANAVVLAPQMTVNSVDVTLPVTNPLFLGIAAMGPFNGYYQFAQLPKDQIPGYSALPVAGQIEQIDAARNQLPQLAPVAQTAVSRITLGAASDTSSQLEIVTIPGEATNTFGQYIRALAKESPSSQARPKTHTMLLGLTHNSFGYIVPEEEFSYIDPSGDTGFVLPYTGYEEFVSLGPLTAPLLRAEGYDRLFTPEPQQYLPPWLSDCATGMTYRGCIVGVIQDRITQITGGAGGAAGPITQGLQELSGYCHNGANPVQQICVVPDTLAQLLGGAPAPGADPAGLATLAAAAADAAVRGCDLLDPSNCLFPFPSDHFTVAAVDGTPQSKAKGGTGKRVNFNITAMPRNVAGKPIDPTEWNRNDGFSPGTPIITYVPNIGTVKGADGKPIGPITGAVPLTDLSQYNAPDAPILVIDVQTGERHPIWAEIDLNAGYVLPAVSTQASPLPKQPALIVRPAKNFIEGHRYVVVLRHLVDEAGKPIPAQAPFQACRDNDATLKQIPMVKDRCDELDQNVFPVLTQNHVARDNALYLSWDFTVASAANDVKRLVHMRDDAFASLGDTQGSAPGDAGYPAGRAPQYSITSVTENPDGAGGKTVRRVQGTVKVPSYLLPADPAALRSAPGQEVLQQVADQCQTLAQGNCGLPGVGSVGDGLELAGSASLPPSRLLYLPDNAAPAPDPSNAQDPTGLRYGDGLPDRNPTGDISVPFTCDIPRSAVNGASSMATATQVKPARPTLYGHGLLGGQGEVNGQASNFGNVYGLMNCAADWFGFASGDLPNVASVLVDLSNFPVIPDASQQGMLNQMFLARLLVHPQGFAADPRFQANGQPVFDRREVFYHGNSQGGILGGVLVAASKDINRGVLGVLGMNYSTLLSRSTDFATYSIPLYLAYPNDLDRPLNFALMQMLWDRSENNGYASQLTDNSAMGGPNNQVLLTPALGDHQVSMWTAEVMARTVGAKLDRHRVRPERHPDTVEYFGIPQVAYDQGGHSGYTGSALVPYDQMFDPATNKERWNSQNDSTCDDNRTNPPPIGNVPPGNAAGADPHECPRRDPQARCQMSHFLLRTPDAGSHDTAPELIDVNGINIFGPNADSGADCPAVTITGAPGVTPQAADAAPDYGPGVIGALARFMSGMQNAIAALLLGDFQTAGSAVANALSGFAANVQTVLTNAFSNPSPQSLATLIGDDPQATVARETKVNRDAEAVVLTGAQLPGWSVPAAQGLPQPYPSGSGLARQCGDVFGAANCAALFGAVPVDTNTRSAHNGTILVSNANGAPSGVPVDRIAAYKWDGTRFVEIPVQVDEKYPYFLANANSGFGIYSGTDEELTYAWDKEHWDPKDDPARPGYAAYKDGQKDPVAGLDSDDEVVFMASDAGTMAPTGLQPEGDSVQMVRLADPLDAAKERVVYLVTKAGGSTYRTQHYVNFQRKPDADQFIDRDSFCEDDPEKLGTSNTGYGPNLGGGVYVNKANCGTATPGQMISQNARSSSDRFPRDGTVVTTDAYRWESSGRWMVRDVRVAKPNQPGVYGVDLIDRWKGRAFQQNPDSYINAIGGFEDEQVNWEANSSLLGERCGPVRCIREVWGADSGTNVTKTETFYRNAVAYRYHLRVHPIPPDGLYTSWDYNRSAMVPGQGENVKGGRYYTALRPNGVPIDGINDDIGQVDAIKPFIPQQFTDALGQKGQCIDLGDQELDVARNGRCPMYFDAPDPTFNLPIAFNNWEQISGKGSNGSLVYLFEIKGPTTLTNGLVVPYYRDDKCFDDGTGDDPVRRPNPGEAAYNIPGYRDLDCNKDQRQGAYGSNGVHFFVTHDSDNAFVLGKPIDEVDGQQWQFMVPTAQPENRGAEYANIVRLPLQPVVVPLKVDPNALGGGTATSSASERGLVQVVTDFIGSIPTTIAGLMAQSAQTALAGFNNLVAGVADVLIGNPHASALALVGGTVGDPAAAPANVPTRLGWLVNGFGSAATGHVKAGVGVVDMTPDVGYGAGQYSDTSDIFDGLSGGDMDPYLTAKKQHKSYGVMSRLTGRAIVIEGGNGKRIALLKSDNYLAQDNLIRRVGQILEEHNSSIGYDQILYHVTHAHSSTYASTLAAGVAVFQDVYDPRQFEYQARRLAEAILRAEANLQPARMGATTVRHKIFKGQIVGPTAADDGTPAGYPNEYGDHGLVVMRIETDEAQPKPIAVWVNWGEHPEGLDGYDLHSADYVGFLERYVERDLKAPLVFSQGDVGSSEKSGNEQQRLRDDGTVCQTVGGADDCAAGEGTWRDWNHKGYMQNERNVRYLADAVVKGWKVIGGETPVDAAVNGIPPNNYVPTVQVPLSNDFPVDYRLAWVPGPLSHPYPSVSNCKTDTTANGNVGVPVAGLPDCGRAGEYGFQIPAGLSGPLATIYATAKAEGLPVPDHYDAPAFGALEENARLKLQAVRLGDMVLASCACEAQVDMILNFESRADNVPDNIYDGFDWACLSPSHAAERVCQRQTIYYDPAEYVNGAYIPGSMMDAAKVARMRAQVHNPADGWDAPDYVPYANSEPADVTKIKGNFTKEELPANRGYKLAVGIGHAGDYNGYTVSYREYMRGDSYRKALTSYGAHTADYMITRMVRLAGAMKGGPELAPELHDVAAQADEARQIALSRAHGLATKNAYETYYAALPPDVGPAKAQTQPGSIGYFNAATFSWVGGSTAIDNPVVTVEHLDGNAWTTFADQSGEVQTKVQWPQGVPGTLQTYAGQQQWLWTANFEAYESFPARLGSTPPGTYRFVVKGCINDGSSDAAQANVTNRFANFFRGVVPGGLANSVFAQAPACRGGAAPYTLTSNRFMVTDQSDAIRSVTVDGNGKLTITASQTAVPKSYASVFRYVSTANDNGRFCRECSFRPWARDDAPLSQVQVVTSNGFNQTVNCSSGSCSVAAGVVPGVTATVTALYPSASPKYRTSRAVVVQR